VDGLQGSYVDLLRGLAGTGKERSGHRSQGRPSRRRGKSISSNAENVETVDCASSHAEGAQ